MYSGSFCDVPGLHVGHAQDFDARTGCTVILADDRFAAGVDVRGAAPGTRETDLLKSENMMEKIDAIVLTGGSAFGLEAASGVMRELEARGRGFDVGIAKVPIVCAAVLFDLANGSSAVRPGAAMGIAALNAATRTPVQGNVGAGCGATVGKMVPGAVPARGGIGMASLSLPGGGTISALIAVNAAGDVYDPENGRCIACGTVNGAPAPAMDLLLGGQVHAAFGRNTTIGVVATDISLDKCACNRLATTAHDGYARAIRPVHTASDGDTLFALSFGDKQCHPVILQAAATEVVARAIANAVLAPKVCP